MARLMNDTAQWIVLMGFVVSFSLFFLAVILNQSTVVGQTTAEAVSEFPKEDIRGVRTALLQSNMYWASVNDQTNIRLDIENISLTRQNAVIRIYAPISVNDTYWLYPIHYNNGVTEYNERWKFP